MGMLTLPGPVLAAMAESTPKLIRFALLFPEYARNHHVSVCQKLTAFRDMGREIAYCFNGEYHRLDGPARIIKKSGAEIWYRHGKRHRIGGPAFVSKYGVEEWWRDGKLYREDDLPAVNNSNMRQWYTNGYCYRPNGLPSVEFLLDSGEIILQIWTDPLGQKHRESDLPAMLTSNQKCWYVSGKKHRVGGPAVLTERCQEWWQNDMLHRTDGPAIVAENRQEWIQYGKRHRKDGPAYIHGNRQKWYTWGLKHRIGGPAIIDKYKETWYSHGLLHRKDGPAIRRMNDSGILIEAWYRNGVLHRPQSGPFAGPAVYENINSWSWCYRGQYHRKDGPAVRDVNVLNDVIETWYWRNQVHRGNDLPAMYTTEGDYKEWWYHGHIHRPNNLGPAIIGQNSKSWMIFGQLHRNIEPAVILRDGTMVWYNNHRLHRPVHSGPAIIFPDGSCKYYLHGEQVFPESNFEIIGNDLSGSLVDLFGD